jgi:hypothetical protein
MQSTIPINPPNVRPAARQNTAASEPQSTKRSLASNAIHTTPDASIIHPASQNTEQISVPQAPSTQTDGMQQFTALGGPSLGPSDLPTGQLQPNMMGQVPPHLWAAVQQVVTNPILMTAAFQYASQFGPWPMSSAPNQPFNPPMGPGPGSAEQQPPEPHAPLNNVIPNRVINTQHGPSDSQCSPRRKSPVVSRRIPKSEQSTNSTRSPSTSRTSLTPHPPMSAVKSSSPRSSIFKHDSGKELLFFADTGINSRSNLVNAIKVCASTYLSPDLKHHF